MTMGVGGPFGRHVTETGDTGHCDQPDGQVRHSGAGRSEAQDASLGDAGPGSSPTPSPFQASTYGLEISWQSPHSKWQDSVFIQDATVMQGVFRSEIPPGNRRTN